jgi:hypothetical protein
VLAIGIERDEELRAMRERVADAGLQRGTLAAVHEVAQHGRASLGRFVGGRVGRAIVHDDHSRIERAQLTHDQADAAGFAECRDHDRGPLTHVEWKHHRRGRVTGPCGEVRRRRLSQGRGFTGAHAGSNVAIIAEVVS